MENVIFDNTFGLNKQALSVGTLLSSYEPSFAKWDKRFLQYKVEFETHTYRNGRERGIIIKMKHPYLVNKKSLCVAIFEGRNHDGLIAVFFKMDRNMDDIGYSRGFTCDDVYGDDYDLLMSQGFSDDRWMYSVNHGEIGKMANYIYEEFEKFYQTEYDYIGYDDIEEEESFKI